jgi:hypothetical protein
MSIRRIRLAVAGFFVLVLLAVIWPGALLFRRAEPFVLGLPFSLFWPVFLIVLSWAVLLGLDAAENRAHGRDDRSAEGEG